MSFVNYQKKEINCKILYCGPSLSGKTSNIKYIHNYLQKGLSGHFSNKTLASETLLYDFLPINIGSNNGFETHFHLYTLPSHNIFDNTTDFLFRGVDGILFVADSQLIRTEENINSLNNVVTQLQKIGKDITHIPFIIQWNKRDLANISSVSDLSKSINSYKFHEVEAEALSGKGVFESLKLLMKFVLVNIKDIN